LEERKEEKKRRKEKPDVTKSILSCLPLPSLAAFCDYFTDKLIPSSKYATMVTKPFILSVVMTGNPFPVTEHLNQLGSLLGHACCPQHQSHCADGKEKERKRMFVGIAFHNSGREIDQDEIYCWHCFMEQQNSC
jgi:hypothetical protein